MNRSHEELNIALKKCCINLNDEQYEFMSQQVNMFLKQIHHLNIFNDRIRNVGKYYHFWQKNKLRDDDIVEYDINAIFANNNHMYKGYFALNGSLYSNDN